MIPDGTVGDVFGHLSLGHFMTRQLFYRETRAIDTGRELILVGLVDLDLLHAFDEWFVDLTVTGYGGKMDHCEKWNRSR